MYLSAFSEAQQTFHAGLRVGIDERNHWKFIQEIEQRNRESYNLEFIKSKLDRDGNEIGIGRVFVLDGTNGYLGLGLDSVGGMADERLHIKGNLKVEAGGITLDNDMAVGGNLTVGNSFVVKNVRSLADNWKSRSVFKYVEFMGHETKFRDGFTIGKIDLDDTTRDAEILHRNNGVFTPYKITGDIDVSKDGVWLIKDNMI